MKREMERRVNALEGGSNPASLIVVIGSSDCGLPETAGANDLIVFINKPGNPAPYVRSIQAL